MAVLDRNPTNMYVVHMKQVTASQARKNWFRILDEVAAGEVVTIERKGRRLVLRAEEETPAEAPVYADVLTAAGVEGADGWRWEWTGEEGELTVVTGDGP